MRLMIKKEGTYEEAELDGNSEILLNITHDNFTNPSAYTSDYTRTFTLPRTARNERLFSHCAALDWLLTGDSSQFNPARKAEALLLMNNGSVYATGSVYISSITPDSYSLQFTGSLVTLFGKLLVAQFGDGLTDWYDADYLDVAINHTFVSYGWMLHELNYYRWSLEDAVGRLTTAANIIGFAPVYQGYYDDFNPKKRMWDNGELAPEIDWIEGGLNEWSAAQFRTYELQPYVHMHMLWQIFREDFPSITGGYSLVLDEGWFNKSGTLGNLVYVLPKLNPEEGRSNSKIPLSRVFGGVKPFSILLQFSKTRHLLWVVDEIGKTVTVVRAKDYYSRLLMDGKVTDLSRLVDFATMTVKPAQAANTVELNLDSLNCDYVEGYADRYGVEYGSKRLTVETPGTETVKMFGNTENDTVKTSAIVSPIINLTDETLVNHDQINFINNIKTAAGVDVFESYPVPLNVKSGKAAGMYGSFYYRRTANQAAPWGMYGGIRLKDGKRVPSVSVVDDFTEELADAEHVDRERCWHIVQGSEGSTYSVHTSMPQLSTVSGNDESVLFAAPREQYTYKPSDDGNTRYLYGECWEGYLTEMYTSTNKTVEVYAYIDAVKLAALKESPFVAINSTLLLLAKLENWNEGNNRCKCTLKQITNINNITS